LITEESKSVDYVEKKATPSGKFPPKDRKDKNDQSKTKNGLFMHRENAKLLEKSVKNAGIETTSLLSVSRRMFI